MGIGDGRCPPFFEIKITIKRFCRFSIASSRGFFSGEISQLGECVSETGKKKEKKL